VEPGQWTCTAQVQGTQVGLRLVREKEEEKQNKQAQVSLKGVSWSLKEEACFEKRPSQLRR